MIVVDDGSTDSSPDILSRFGNSIKPAFFCSNRGVNQARNHGLSKASGEYVLFLDADDFLKPDAVDAQVRQLKKTGADLCFGDWRYWVMNQNRTGRSERHNRKRNSGDDLTVSLLKDWWCPPFAYLYRRLFLLENNLVWNEKLGFPDDFEYILRVSLCQPAVTHVSEITGYYRKHDGVRLSKIDAEKWMRNVICIYELAKSQLCNQGRWQEPYIDTVCAGYLNIGRRMIPHDPVCFHQMLAKISQLKPDFSFSRKRYAWAASLLGYEWVEKMSQFKRRGRRSIEDFLCKALGK